jgi:uncharacterized membrane protein
MLRAATPERLNAVSDAIFAVLITILVLDLRPPALPAYRSLLLLWPRWLSYAVSYLFIAIVWANHHHLLRYANEATPRLLWFNFAHLFSVSLLPLATAWMAVSELAPQPVSFYALVFFLVNATYILLIRELIDRSPIDDAPPLPLRRRRDRRTEISSGWISSLYLLPDRLSKTRGARSADAKCSHILGKRRELADKVPPARLRTPIWPIEQVKHREHDRHRERNAGEHPQRIELKNRYQQLLGANDRYEADDACNQDVRKRLRACLWPRLVIKFGWLLRHFSPYPITPRSAEALSYLDENRRNRVNASSTGNRIVPKSANRGDCYDNAIPRADEVVSLRTCRGVRESPTAALLVTLHVPRIVRGRRLTRRCPSSCSTWGSSSKSTERSS